MNKKTTKVVIIGNVCFDYIYNKGKIIKECGGSAFYSSIASSKYTPTGIVSLVGEDFDKKYLKLISERYNLKDVGLKITNGQTTTAFFTKYTKDDGSERFVKDFINYNLIPRPKDIPKEFLSAKYFHITTNPPEYQYELVSFLRSNTNAVISVDTIDDYCNNQLTKKVFDSVDIAFVDREYSKLINCDAPIKIIKYGKVGVGILSGEKETFVPNATQYSSCVDKTGAGDILNGAIIGQISCGVNIKTAVKNAQSMATLSTTQYGIEHLL